MSGFVGRQAQLQALKRAAGTVQVGSSDPGRCLLLRGRRRVGKSRLVEEFIARSKLPHVFFTASRQDAREPSLFAQEAAESTLANGAIFAGTNPADWEAALRLLNASLPADELSVVVIDEFPYLLEHDEAVGATFQKHWDRHLSKKPVLLLLIGSDLAMMEQLNTYGNPFYQRGTEMDVGPLTPVETASIIGIDDAADVFDAFLITGGLPLICNEWPPGMTFWEYLEDALNEPTSALIVSAERALAAEFPERLQARQVLEAIGAGERTRTNIGNAMGGLQPTSLQRSLDLLTDKRVVARDDPLSTKSSKNPRYRVADPYLRFWLRFIGPHVAEIERGRGDRVLARIQADWTTWRGRAIEPVIREALHRLLPTQGLPDANAIGGYWPRDNIPEIDLVGADRAPVAKKILFAGTIKWLQSAPLDNSHIHELIGNLAKLPGATPATALVAVSRSGVTATGVTAKFGPAELLAAWQ